MSALALEELPLRIAHLGSLHCGDATFSQELMRTVVDGVKALKPDLVVVAGDLTAAGYEWEYEQAAGWLAQLHTPQVVVPGNHDSRNVGYVHFQERYGERFFTRRVTLDRLRAERLGVEGITVVGADSSQPDLDDGHIGREWYGWLRTQFTNSDDFKVFVVHHHLVSIPGTGRELNLITDAGDLLPILTGLGVDVALTGHKHVPYFWGLNGMLMCNCGTASTYRLRGSIPPSWNELRVDAATIKVFTHYADGRRELSAVRSRATRSIIRETFLVTDDFYDTNQVLLA